MLEALSLDGPDAASRVAAATILAIEAEAAAGLQPTTEECGVGESVYPRREQPATEEAE
jgi:hypothetical protein